jgi:hypothetical protein
MNKSRENQISPIPYGLQPGQARQDHPVLAPEVRAGPENLNSAISGVSA